MAKRRREAEPGFTLVTFEGGCMLFDDADCPQEQGDIAAHIRHITNLEVRGILSVERGMNAVAATEAYIQFIKNQHQ